MGTLLGSGNCGGVGTLLESGTVGVWEHYWSVGLLGYENIIREWDCWGMGTLLERRVGLLGMGTLLGSGTVGV